MKKGFVPYSLNLVTEMFESTEFLESLLEWNFVPTVGHTSYFKLYYKFRVPLNLFPTLPEFQLEFGPRAILPYVKPNEFGISGIDWDGLTLTDCICSGKPVYKADTRADIVFDDIIPRANVMLSNVNSLSCVAEVTLDFAHYSDTSANPGHLEQLAIACPNLQRLNLDNNYDCLRSLKGLRMIGNHCHDLRGLSLMHISSSFIESCMGLWEILSHMNLTHLVIDVCVFQPVIDGNLREQQLIDLYQKCSSLQALQLASPLAHVLCHVCAECDVKWSLLSHFPVLKYCKLPGNHSDLIQDVINGCKELTVLSCHCDERLLISSVFVTNLQQLSITSRNTNIPDVFLETVSTHGGLVHVALYVNSMTLDGICNLIINSPKLLTLILNVENIIEGCRIRLKGNLKETMQQRFSGRKLFTVGSFKVETSLDYLHGTDLLPLWLQYYPF